MTKTIKSAAVLMSQSALNDSLSQGLFDDDVHLDLIANCSGYEETENGYYYYGSSHTGRAWRVELVHS